MIESLTENEIIKYRSKIKSTEEINLIYKNKSKEQLAQLSPSFNLSEKDIDGEVWKEYKAKYTNSKNIKLEVSNFGRVRYSDTKEILEQVDVADLKGYLYLKDFCQVQKRLGFKFQDDCVYQMVAKTFLAKPLNNNCILDIHHIDNDGYNNQVENLMYITRDDHNRIHKGVAL